MFFEGWYFEIGTHHYWTLGVELKTFVKKKIRYQCWAYMTPSDYNFCQGYIFYAKADQDHFLQLGAERDLFGIEVFEGHRSRPETGVTGVTGWITTLDGLALWLRTGRRPMPCRAVDFADSKSGLMAWQLIDRVAGHETSTDH